MTCIFDSEATMKDYEFSTPVPSVVFPDFEFDFAQLMAGMLCSGRSSMDCVARSPT